MDTEEGNTSSKIKKFLAAHNKEEILRLEKREESTEDLRILYLSKI